MNLQQLEKKYKELGKEIERLKQQKFKINEEYFFVDDNGLVCSKRFFDNDIDFYHLSQGNRFKTKQEAQEHLENLKTKGELRLLAEELNGEEVIDWENISQFKIYLYYDFCKEQLNYWEVTSKKVPGTIYCLDKNFLTEALNHIGKERLIKMIKSGV